MPSRPSPPAGRAPAALLLLAVACGGGDGTPDAAPDAESPPAPGEHATVAPASPGAGTDPPPDTGAVPDTSQAPVRDTARAGESGAGSWTEEATHRGRPEARLATLVAVETGRHPDFDRLVLTFANSVPGFAVQYVRPPAHACGSGHPVPLEGGAVLEVRVEPAAAHTEAGEPTVSERARRPGLPALREARLTCDFEAVVTWALGIARRAPYRVLELRDPARLVVDVRH